MTVKKKPAQAELPFEPGHGSQAQVRYVNKRGEFCPACGSEEVDEISFMNLENGIGHRDLACSCGASWTEQFQLVAFCNFTASKKGSQRKARRAERRRLRKEKGK